MRAGIKARRRAFSVAGPSVPGLELSREAHPGPGGDLSADCFRRLLDTHLFAFDTSAFIALEVLDDNRATV